MILKLTPLILLIAAVECQFNSQDATLAMLERVNEPLFIPKCETGVMLEVPTDYLPSGYQEAAIQNQLNNRFRNRIQIPIKKIQIPDVSDLLALPRLGTFSTFVPRHRKLSARLITLFMEMRTVEDFFALAAYLRDRINPSLFVYAFSVAIMNRQDTRNVRLPPVSETFPGRYVDGSVFVRAREESYILSDSLVSMRATIEIPQDYTATQREPEHRVAYFREDLGINLHHWHWHLIYPFEGPREVVQKNRRGELFYYAHQQIIGRYDFERLCNKLPRTVRLQNFAEPIPEAYFPKLTSQIASRNWQSRPGGLRMRDINREADQLKVDIADLERWRARFLEAIERGRVESTNGTTIPLTEQNGIDILGDMMEPSQYSVNPQLYGQLHNMLHVVISLIHDPDHRFLETFSVIGEASTAMRDPAFYRIHSLVNDIFNLHKQSLPRYTVQQLEFQGIQVRGIEISTKGTTQRNTFMTYWEKSTVDLSRGMDFFPRGPVFARFTHLQHMPFTLNVDVTNSGQRRQALIRVFLAPKLDERGRDMPLVEQRNMFIELDKFLYDLQPGANKIVRNSVQSTVSIPFEQTFRDLETGRPPANNTGGSDNFNFCGCGWPHHMLIPKGNIEGFPSILFVMISNAETDWVRSFCVFFEIELLKMLSFCPPRILDGLSLYFYLIFLDHHNEMSTEANF
ncbi:Hypothetical predicted protein [Cloeon dipterum]|uniref:Tyrosinase copper-binding domain-containing protein n=1 Tax=Cloeon dipterum TaxID=197152 RepID=A0A8S1C4G7_9INSE|nr:Hypothetical predicted protein [Cloeon dipterum]